MKENGGVVLITGGLGYLGGRIAGSIEEIVI